MVSTKQYLCFQTNKTTVILPFLTINKEATKNWVFPFTSIPLTNSESAPAPLSLWPGLQKAIVLNFVKTKLKILYEKEN